MFAPIFRVEKEWFAKARQYQDQLVMPSGSLGRILDIAQQLCAIQETLRPVVEPAAVVVMAADHGIAEEGVSDLPQIATSQMVANLLAGNAAINVIAHGNRCHVFVVDVGVKNSAVIPAKAKTATRFVHMPVAAGTHNFRNDAAMSEEQMTRAIKAGQVICRNELVTRKAKVVLTGEIGIANTMSAIALTAVLTGKSVKVIMTSGSDRSEHQIQVIETALQKHELAQVRDPLQLLQTLGGFEIAALVGLIMEAAKERMVIVLDGFVTAVAALIAYRLNANVLPYLIASHLSDEPPHATVLEELRLQPLLNLGMHLGEGSGAALAFPLIRSAAKTMTEMATFTSASIKPWI